MSYATNHAIEAQKPTHIRPSHHTAARRQRTSSRSQTGERILEHYLRRIDPEVAASFTPEQRDAIGTMLGARGVARHLVEVRRSAPLGRRRWYVVLLMGSERRSISRLRREGVASRRFDVLVYLGLAAVLIAPVLGLIAALGL